MKDLKELKNNEHKISNPYVNEKGRLMRTVDGVEIKQIEEKTESDVRKNYLINLWRMRNN